MKNIILLITLLFTQSLLAAGNESKTIELKATVVKMMLEKPGQYRLELLEHAAAYTADEKSVPCLKQSIETKKAVKLKVTAYTQKVLECSVHQD